MASEKSQLSDYTTLGIAAVAIGTITIERFWKAFSIWIRSPWNQALLCIALTAVLASLFYWMAERRARNSEKRKREAAVIGPAESAVYCGTSTEQEPVFIKTKQRGMHTQVIGTTNAGKTESVILPWAIQDIEQGRGLILIDGKADRSLLDKLWAYAVKAGREKDFRLFS